MSNSIAEQEELWNRATEDERIQALRKAGTPEYMDVLRRMARLRWHQLSPFTQRDIEKFWKAHPPKGYGKVTEQAVTLKTAYAELSADRDYLALTPREQRFIETFLGTVSGDRFADGANFQSDLRSYGYKNVTRLLAVYNRHYPTFAAMTRPEGTDGKPQKIPEGRAALMGDLETALEGMLSDLGWKPAVNVDWTKEGIRAELEDWESHDPSVGIFGGKEATVTFDITEDGMTTKWRWEPHVEADRQRETEAHFLKHEREIYQLVSNILMGR